MSHLSTPAAIARLEQAAARIDDLALQLKRAAGSIRGCAEAFRDDQRAPAICRPGRPRPGPRRRARS
jgi:hypothetical protein